MTKKRSFRISTFGSRITSVISVTLVLLILGVVAVTALLGRGLSSEIRSNMGLIVKVDRTASESEVSRLRGVFATAPYVEDFTYASPEAILESESQYIGRDLTEILDENPYGAEFDIRVREEYATADSIDILAQRLLYDAAIDDVVTDTAVVEGVNRTIARATVAMLLLALALLIISVVLINNAVSLSIYARRFLIHTMKLVGATGGFIRAPFVKAGAANGLVAGLAASALLAALLGWAFSLDPIVARNVSWFDAAMVFTAMVILGIGICTLASLFATNRYLRRNYDEMFMK